MRLRRLCWELNPCLHTVKGKLGGEVLKQNGKQNTKTKPEGSNRVSLYAIKREKRTRGTHHALSPLSLDGWEEMMMMTGVDQK